MLANSALAAFILLCYAFQNALVETVDLNLTTNLTRYQLEELSKIIDSNGACFISCKYIKFPCDCTKYSQCQEGTLSTYSCPSGAPYFDPVFGACGTDPSNCNLSPKLCCPCGYLATGVCDDDYLYQKYKLPYYGPDQCQQDHLICHNGGVFNTKLGVQGQCDSLESCLADAAS